MAFDMGFDFRNTAGFVTDPAYGVPVLAEAYPHTYTNGNGLSINAGWSVLPQGAEDRAAGNDPRIAGENFRSNSGPASTFTVDLSSGSAPGAGTYSIDLASGGVNQTSVVDFKLFDNATLLIDGTNGGAGTSIGVGHFLDASLADVTASTTWTGTPVTKTFATTTVNYTMAIDGLTDFSYLSHLRLTLQGGLSVTVDPLVIKAGLSDVSLSLTPAATGTGGSLLLLGLQFTRPASGGGLTLTVDPLVVNVNLPDVGLSTNQPIAYSVTVDPLAIQVNLPDVGLALNQHQAYTLAVDPLLISVFLPDVGLNLTPQKLSITVDTLAVTVMLGDVVLSVSPFVPPRTPFLPSGIHPYLEYRRHRRMGR